MTGQAKPGPPSVSAMTSTRSSSAAAARALRRGCALVLTDLETQASGVDALILSCLA